MANADNLKGHGFDSLTADERRERASEAGKASGAARRRRKSMKAAAKMLLDMPVAPSMKELQKKIKLLGVSEDDVTYQTAIMVAMLTQAMAGNVKAATFYRDTIGETQGYEIRREELRLSKARFEYEKAKDELERTEETSKASLADAIQAAYEDRKKEREEGGKADD